MLTSPLCFVSSVIVAVIMTLFFVCTHLNNEDKNFTSLRQEYKTDIEKQRNDIIHYIDKLYSCLNYKTKQRN